MVGLPQMHRRPRAEEKRPQDSEQDGSDDVVRLHA